MTVAEVRVAGRRLSSVGAVSDLQDSTIFRVEGWSGDYQASCVVAMPSRGAPPWLRRGALWETYEAGLLTWAGFVDEVSFDGPTVRLSAYGRGARASSFPALTAVTSGTASTTHVPNVAVDAAEARGLGFGRAGLDIGSSATADTPLEVATVGTVLDREAARRGKRWWVDSWGRVTYRDPGELKWVMRPGEDYVGTADDEYVSRLWALFISAQDTEGNPTAVSAIYAPNGAGVEERMRDTFGPSEQVVDYTALGRLYSVAGFRPDFEARFARTGGRMGWTNGLDLTATNMHRAGTRVPAPLSVRAGDRVLLPGVNDNNSSATYRPNVELTLGEVVRIHDEDRAQVKPVGFAARGFSAALANAQGERDFIQSA